MPRLPERRSDSAEGIRLPSGRRLFRHDLLPSVVPVFLGQSWTTEPVLSTVGELVGAAWRAIPAILSHVGLDWFRRHAKSRPRDPRRLRTILGRSIRQRRMLRPYTDLRRRERRAVRSRPSFRTSRRRPRGAFDSLPTMEGLRLWQRGFYDHVIRRRRGIQPYPPLHRGEPSALGAGRGEPATFRVGAKHTCPGGRCQGRASDASPAFARPPHCRCGLRNCPV